MDIAPDGLSEAYATNELDYTTFSPSTNTDCSTTSAHLQWEDDTHSISGLPESTIVDPALMTEAYQFTPASIASPSAIETHRRQTQDPVYIAAAESNLADHSSLKCTIATPMTEKYLLKYFLDDVAPWVSAPL